MKLQRLSCAFTGHRPHKLPWKDNENDSRCIVLKKTLAEQITVLVEAGITDFFNGMAEGTDQYCAQIILALREKNPALNLHCVLPCEGQETKWSNFAQERYHYILEHADSIEYVSRAYYNGCMIDRNHRLVESSGILLAVYSGVRRSGTAATINYAYKMGREIIVIDPTTQSITYKGIA